MIPKGWKKSKISEVAVINVGRDVQEDAFSETETNTHVYPVYSNTVENRGLYGYYNFQEYDGNSLTVVGRGAGLGTAFARNSGFGAIGRLLVISPKEDFDVRYFAEYVNNKLCLFHESGGIPQLPGEAFGKYEIILPPLPEQKAIAEVLSVWDRAIEKTERLIQAKEKRFKGLLQTLINPADKSGWEKVHLKDVAKIRKGSQRNRDGLDDAGEYPAMNGGIGPSGYTAEWNTEANTVTISEGGNSCGFVNYVTQRFWCGGHCYALTNIHSEIENEYLFHFLKHHEPALMRLRVGSGLPNIQKKDVDDFPVEFPPLPEQKRIAETLTLAQREIELLKKLAEKQKMQKRGLMQKLLTGEWRVNLENPL